MVIGGFNDCDTPKVVGHLPLIWCHKITFHDYQQGYIDSLFTRWIIYFANLIEAVTGSASEETIEAFQIFLLFEMSLKLSDLARTDSGLRCILNHESQKLAASQSQITCPVHEWCNGTCQASEGMSPAIFEPLLGNGEIFEVSSPETSFPEGSLARKPSTIADIELQEFEYKPLEFGNAIIRLILIEPQVFLDDPVVIKLIELSHDSRSSYAALSYR